MVYLDADKNIYGDVFMEKIVINGGTRLVGEVKISGAKNAAVAILPATLLINGKCTITNLPDISDVKILCKIMEKLGAKITWHNPNEITIDNSNITSTDTDVSLTSQLRASYYMLGALLGRFGSASVGLPGGCNLGPRPIDQHIKALETLGATVDVSRGIVNASVDNKDKRLIGNDIYFDIVSVGATMNAILAACLADGVTVIENAAKEPHIVDLANFINKMGGDVIGAGTNEIKITGVKKLKTDMSYEIVPDQIEAGTFMFAAVASSGDITLTHCIPEHLDCITTKIEEMGANVEYSNTRCRVIMNGKPKATNITTLPYPGFPTDLQAQAGVCLAVSDGTSIINESIWESRFNYTGELTKMGANITNQGRSAVFEGVDKLYGAPIEATDLRAGAALLIAGVIANGETTVGNLHYIDRGYENIVEKFKSLGADIRRINE